MADNETMNAFRIRTGITESDLPSAELNVLLDENNGDLRAAAAVFYDREAQKYAKLVNVSESGSSRSLGDLHKNAIAMAKHYRGIVEVETSEKENRARTRPMTRS